MATLDVYDSGGLIVRYAGFNAKSRRFQLEVGFFQHNTPVFDNQSARLLQINNPDTPPGFIHMHEVRENRFLDAIDKALGPARQATWCADFPPFMCQMRVLERAHGQDRIGLGSAFLPIRGTPLWAYQPEIDKRARKRVERGQPLDDDYVEMLFVFAEARWAQGPAYVLRPLYAELKQFADALRDDWSAQWHAPDVQRVFNPPPPRRRPTKSFAESIVINDLVAVHEDRFEAVDGTACLPPPETDFIDNTFFEWLVPNNTLKPNPAKRGEPKLFTLRGAAGPYLGLQVLLARPRSEDHFTLALQHPYNFKNVGHLVLVDSVEVTTDRTQARLNGRVVNSRAEHVDGPSFSAYITNWQYARHRVRAGGIFSVSLAILATKIRTTHERRWITPQSAALPVEFCLKPTGDGPIVLEGLHPDAAWWLNAGGGRPDDIAFSGPLHDAYDLTRPYLGQKAVNAVVEILPGKPRDFEVGLTITRQALEGDRWPWRGDWVEGTGWLTAEIGEFEDFRFDVIEEAEPD